jgi:hypothetical protein
MNHPESFNMFQPSQCALSRETLDLSFGYDHMTLRKKAVLSAQSDSPTLTSILIQTKLLKYLKIFQTEIY